MHGISVGAVWLWQHLVGCIKMFWQRGNKVLFVGDSITDADRRKPLHAPLGWGYVRLLHDLFVARHGAEGVHFVNRGIGGNTVDDLRSRWHEDVILHRPDLLCIQVGMNDLNQFLCDSRREFLSPEGFSAIYEQIVKRTRDELPETRMLLLTPFFLSTDAGTGSYRARVLDTLKDYLSGVEALAATHGVPTLNLHEIFQKRLQREHPDVYCEEPVHPNSTGHMVIAESLYHRLTGKV